MRSTQMRWQCGALMLVLVAVAFLAVAPGAAAQNLPNGDFETWTDGQADGWVETNENSSYVQETGNVHGGSSAALVNPEATYSGIRQTGLTFTPDTTYILTAYLRGAGTAGDGADNVRLLFVDYLSSGGPLFTTAGTGGTLNDTDYQAYTLEFTTDPLHTGAEIQFGAFQNPENNAIAFYIDDVSIVEVGGTPEDTTPPVISLNGPDQIALSLNDTFVDPVTASDDVDGDLTDALRVVIRDSDDAVVADDAAMMGAEDIYTRTYTVADAAGNEAVPVVLTVDVWDDVDMDGLPDTWELAYFESLDFGPGDDPDGDGVTNIEEYQDGTNPMEFNPTETVPVSGPIALLALLALFAGLGMRRATLTRR